MAGMESEQQFSLSWNNFHGNVSRELSALLGSGTLADVTLAVGGQLLQAHRLVLAICSPYFKRMFEANPHHHPIVVLRDVSHAAMCSLLQFMYHGEVSVRREDLTGFIATAELLQIKGLTNKENDEEEIKNRETPKPTQELASHNRHCDTIPPSPEDAHTAEIKRKMLSENIQRLNHLKRTSEQFLHNFYQMEHPEKHPRSQNHTFSDEAPADMSYMEKSQDNEKSNDYSAVDLKIECDDDIVIADPAVQDKLDDCHPEPLSKNFMMANHDSGLASLFVDLKSFVNGRFVYRTPLSGDSKDHTLMPIPQKLDGKKKYPQRCCRSCGQVGRRRDTRFMCSLCAIPFCKTPCFELHVRHLARNALDSEPFMH